MVSARKVLRSFLDDALRMCTQAQKHLEAAPGPGEEDERIRSLYHIVHTLKGTATMICGGDQIVETLHALEDSLATGNARGLWRSSEWLEIARVSIARTRMLVSELRDREWSQGCDPEETGLLVRAGDRLFWFAIGNTGAVLPACELSGRNMILSGGEWLPLREDWVSAESVRAVASHGFGVVVRNEAGKMIVLVNDVLGVMPWQDASRQGAIAGVDLLESPPPAEPVKDRAEAAARAA